MAIEQDRGNELERDAASRSSQPDLSHEEFLILAKRPERKNDGVDLTKAFAYAIGRWYLLVIVAILGGAAAAAAAWTLPNKYRAEVLLAPVKPTGSDSLGGLKSQVGGIAALAGIDLGGSAQTDESFATLSSRGFAREFIATHELLPFLFEQRFDTATQKWRSGVKVPSIEDGVDMFTKTVCAVSEDRKTHLITISVETTSPDRAAQWANGLVELVNERLRQDAVKNADQNVRYLREELQRTSVVELQQAIYRLMESQINQAMLASVQRQFAFRVLDKAVPPEKIASPHRRTMVAIGVALPILVTFFILLAVFVFRQAAQSNGPAR